MFNTVSSFRPQVAFGQNKETNKSGNLSKRLSDIKKKLVPDKTELNSLSPAQEQLGNFLAEFAISASSGTESVDKLIDNLVDGAKNNEKAIKSLKNQDQILKVVHHAAKLYVEDYNNRTTEPNEKVINPPELDKSTDKRLGDPLVYMLFLLSMAVFAELKFAVLANEQKKSLQA